MQAVSTIPVFKLYGEEQGWPTPDLLHCESILQRSHLYEWHIRLHQHAELVQLLYLHKGQAEIEIEGTTTVMRESCIQIVPALCIHGFRFSRVRKATSCRWRCRCSEVSKVSLPVSWMYSASRDACRSRRRGAIFGRCSPLCAKSIAKSMTRVK